MKKSWIWVYLVTVAVGTALHFLYGLVPSSVTAVFASVNESVWEHVKLVYWPLLLAGALLQKRAPDKKRLWAGVLGAILAVPVWQWGVYYILKGGFGVSALWIDLLLYYGFMAAGFLFIRKIQKRDLPKWAFFALIACVAVLGVLLVYFTTFPPKLPIFTVG